MNDLVGTLCEICGDKPPEKNRKACSACRKRQQRQKATPEELSGLLDEAESYGCRVDRETMKVWRPLVQGGEWVTPHACKHGVHLNPNCEKGGTGA